MLTFSPFKIKGRRLVLLAGDVLSSIESKTAACFLMYRAADVVAVVERSTLGRTSGDVLGLGGAPIVGTVEEALRYQPDVAIVGTAPRGGALESAMREEVLACLYAGIDVVSGLHVFLADDIEFHIAMSASGAKIWDVRRVVGQQTVSTGRGCTTGARSVLVVGTDCNVGKMTVSVELCRAAVQRGRDAAWAATGQTGIMLRERGVCVDRVVADFIGGAAEEVVNAEGEGKDIVFVEGQGAIVHPGYAGVALGLLYGVMPDCMVMVHDASRNRMKNLDVAVEPVPELISLHERLLAPFKRSRVVAVAINTRALTDDEATRAIAGLREETGLPTTDPVRFGCDDIIDAVLGEEKQTL